MMRLRTPPTVLLASADQTWRVACAERLLRSGCDVHTAATGFRAMDDLRKHQYDLVVFDDSMPDLTVFEMHLNIQDLAYNAPRQLIATLDGSRKEHARMKNGSDVVDVGTPEEVLKRLGPAIQRMHAHQN